MAISKTFYQTIELSVVPFDMVRSRILGRSVSCDGGPQNGDERQWRASTRADETPRDTEGGTIRFTESAIDHQLNGQDFRLIRYEPCQSSVALDPYGLLSVLFARFLGASGG
jgi:hypothetical protein